MKVITKDDVRRLIDRNATRTERLELAVMLGDADPERGLNGMDAKEQKDVLSGASLMKSLWYQHQTFGGYILRDPPLEELCQDIAKRMRIAGSIDPKIMNAWNMLEVISGNMLTLALKREAADRKKPVTEVLRDLIGASEYGKLKRKHGRDLAKFITGGGAIWFRSLGFAAMRNVMMNLVQQTARILLGHGLSFVASQTVLKVAAKTASRALLWLNPIGWFFVVWGLNDLTGTNFKRVIPACLLLYTIRARVENRRGRGTSKSRRAA